MTSIHNVKQPSNATAVIVTATGDIFWGRGLGAETTRVGEICFNTSMTGYQEILTDPSYAGQIITFTFPHIGNVGTNDEDIETRTPHSRGAIIREDITTPSNWRANAHFDAWLKEHDLPAIAGVDTRAMTQAIRDNGAPNGVICYNADGKFDLEALHKQAKEWPGLEGMDLATEVSCDAPYEWSQAGWTLAEGYNDNDEATHHIVAIDFGSKLNILRCLAQQNCKVTVVPAKTSAEEILALNPDGIFLSNGPGDPAATGEYAIPTIRKLVESGKPIFGICLGHQLLSLALGAKTGKMHLGHRGANHPVKDVQTGRVEITSQNHGFQVLSDSLPDDVEQTHVSLFDNSNEGIRLKGKPVFSVQYHPEASPGPHDSHYLFEKFIDLIKAA
ncbi:MAG: glutamine-hydrolyzing carbamoyl-phosphate synthase small subunit [Alphaproteobacteria bacterium]|jgi:carbamoyl-phosphate synthase small subunit|nr:glutamine-hydrolyzing carbamoyl-phosphate synthase small subunit [Alphaproteobacteria bacterium]MDP7222018.1 glutamine-hydrolyzing carbamoyl-phosphate synthase small subunit [Alphaproteobacteria bacterium]